MIANLTQELDLYHFNRGDKVKGAHCHLLTPHPNLWGNCTYLYGNCCELQGDCTGISGDGTGVYGDCTHLLGSLDACDISAEDRKAGVDIDDLIGG
jgi:hypothetical protein